jgi:hypothetical protein
MGWHANNLVRLGRMLTEMANVYVDVGAVLYDIGRQPRAAHDFFSSIRTRLYSVRMHISPKNIPITGAYSRLTTTTSITTVDITRSGNSMALIFRMRY